MLDIFNNIAGLLIGSVILIVLVIFIFLVFYTSWPLFLCLLLGAICLAKGYLFLAILLIFFGFCANSFWASKL